MKSVTFIAMAILFSGIAGAEDLASLMGMIYNGKGVTIQVPSGGCTGKGSFKFVHLETDPVQLKIVVVKPDFCEAYLPYGVTLTYTYAEMGFRSGDSFTVMNKIGSDVIRAR